MLRSQVPSCIGKRPRVVDTPTFVAARALLDEWPAAELDKTRNIKAAQDFKVGVCVRIRAPEPIAAAGLVAVVNSLPHSGI